MDDIEHGIEVACYSNGPFGYQPFMACLCGFRAKEDSWAKVGAAMDEHLREVREREEPSRG